MNFEKPSELAIREVLQSDWIQHAHWQDEVDSTNEVAKRWLAERSSIGLDLHTDAAESGLSLPALFVADRQTAGRGRGMHSWWSPSGCLMLTMVIGSDLMPTDPNEWSQLALVCGVAAAEAVERFVEPQASVQLKWPNDVYLEGKKCAGILIESARVSQARNRSANDGSVASDTAWLIGIGMNVDVDFSSAEKSIADRATSISSHLSASDAGIANLRTALDTPQVLIELTRRLQYWIHNWTTNHSAWLANWQDRCLLSGKVLLVRTAEASERVARCEGVDASGKLVLRTDAGVELMNSGEVVRWD